MPAFTKHEEYSWVSTPTAMGPFKGLQGGAVAGLMVSELEHQAADLDLGVAVSATIEFLRPTGEGVLRTAPTIDRQGRRVSVLSNRVFEGDQCTAQARVCFIKPGNLASIPAQEPENLNPDNLAVLPPRKALHGQPWMMDNFEVRRSEDGIVWFRYVDEIVENAAPMARVLGPADWTHGLSRPQSPKLADPNINLHVVLSRSLIGDDIGIRPKTTWMPSGVGMGEGILFDTEGAFGRIAMSVALTEFN